jgi:hypothetical protein
MWVDVEQSALEEDDVIRLKEYPEAGEWTYSLIEAYTGGKLIFTKCGLKGIAALPADVPVQRWEEEEKNVG